MPGAAQVSGGRQGGEQPVDVPGGAAQPDARAQRGRRQVRPPAPGGRLGEQPPGQRVRTEEPVPQPELPALGEVGRDRRRVPAGDHERDDADPGRGRVEGTQFDHLRQGGEPGPQPGEQGLLVRVQRAAVRPGQGSADRGQRHRAEQVGRARLVPGGPLDPAHVMGGRPDPEGRTATGQVRRGGVEPVRPSGQYADSERRVQLVSGNGHVVDCQGGDVQFGVRGELGGVQRDPGAVPVGDPGQVGDRPALAGDVAGPGHRDQDRCAAAAAPAQFPQCRVDRSHGVGDRAGHRQPDRTGGPGQQVRVVLGGEGHHPGAGRQGPGQQVERVGGVAGEDDVVVRA
ncbi:hypothetical protein GCM10027615_19430 [Plantactinospora veratri]